jgi:hypothetical protein
MFSNQKTHAMQSGGILANNDQNSALMENMQLK